MRQDLETLLYELYNLVVGAGISADVVNGLILPDEGVAFDDKLTRIFIFIPHIIVPVAGSECSTACNGCYIAFDIRAGKYYAYQYDKKYGIEQLCDNVLQEATTQVLNAKNLVQHELRNLQLTYLTHKVNDLAVLVERLLNAQEDSPVKDVKNTKTISSKQND